jgi:cytochrome c peroxidase
MQLRIVILAFALTVGLLAAGFDWNLPEGFPRPAVPSDNPMSNAKVELGRYLFYDKRISFNGKESCGSCHRQELAFTDGRARAEGTTGQLHPRSSMSLANVAYAAYLTWGNQRRETRR